MLTKRLKGVEFCLQQSSVGSQSPPDFEYLQYLINAASNTFKYLISAASNTFFLTQSQR